MKTKRFNTLLLALALSTAYADPRPFKEYKHPKSSCVVTSSAGEYPSFIVRVADKIVFAPSSDGIVEASFSPSGKYAVLTSGEVSGIDVQKDKFEFAMAIVNCQSGKVRGYVLADCPSLPKMLAACTNYVSDLSWDKSERTLSYRFHPGLDQKTDQPQRKIDFSSSPLP